MTTIEESADAPVDTRAFSREVLILVATGALLLGLLLGVGIGAIAFGGDEAPAQQPATGQPPEPGEGPGSAQLDEDAFAPEGEIGTDQ